MKNKRNAHSAAREHHVIAIIGLLLAGTFGCQAGWQLESPAVNRYASINVPETAWAPQCSYSITVSGNAFSASYGSQSVSVGGDADTRVDLWAKHAYNVNAGDTPVAQCYAEASGKWNWVGAPGYCQNTVRVDYAVSTYVFCETKCYWMIGEDDLLTFSGSSTGSAQVQGVNGTYGNPYATYHTWNPYMGTRFGASLPPTGVQGTSGTYGYTEALTVEGEDIYSPEFLTRTSTRLSRAACDITLTGSYDIPPGATFVWLYAQLKSYASNSVRATAWYLHGDAHSECYVDGTASISFYER